MEIRTATIGRSGSRLQPVEAECFPAAAATKEEFEEEG